MKLGIKEEGGQPGSEIQEKKGVRGKIRKLYSCKSRDARFDIFREACEGENMFSKINWADYPVGNQLGATGPTFQGEGKEGTGCSYDGWWEHLKVKI